MFTKILRVYRSYATTMTPQKTKNISFLKYKFKCIES